MRASGARPYGTVEASVSSSQGRLSAVRGHCTETDMRASNARPYGEIVRFLLVGAAISRPLVRPHTVSAERPAQPFFSISRIWRNWVSYSSR